MNAYIAYNCKFYSALHSWVVLYCQLNTCFHFYGATIVFLSRRWFGEHFYWMLSSCKTVFLLLAEHPVSCNYNWWVLWWVSNLNSWTNLPQKLISRDVRYRNFIDKPAFNIFICGELEVLFTRIHCSAGMFSWLSWFQNLFHHISKSLLIL